MKKLISCKFNFDTVCVELQFSDDSMITIDTIAVENEVARNMYERSELDYLIYNDPIAYDDKMLITFNYKEGTKTITFDDVKNEVSEETSGSDLNCSSAPYRVFITKVMNPLLALARVKGNKKGSRPTCSRIL